MAFKNAKQRAAFFAMKRAKEEGKLQSKESLDPEKEIKKINKSLKFSNIEKLLKSKIKV